MVHFSSMCFSSTLNPQVLLYDGHGIHFDYRVLNILQSHHIQTFILKTGHYVHDQSNNNGPNLKLNNLYDNARMNWMSNHGTIKFTPSHINSVLVETWSAFKISSAKITQESSKKTHLPPPFPYWTKSQTTKLSYKLLKFPTVGKWMIYNQ